MPTSCQPSRSKTGPKSGRVGMNGASTNNSNNCGPRGTARQWTSCASPKPLCVPHLKMNDITCTADQERTNLKGLNDTLANHHDHVKALCAKAASCVDPSTYREAIRTLENEIRHIRAMYEQELSKTRKALDDVNKDRSCLVSKAGANSNLASSLQARLNAEEATNKKAHDNIQQLQVLLAQKEKEVCDLRACLDTRDRELSQLKPRVNQLCCEVQELRSRLAKENEARVVAEERSKQLNNKYTFDRTAACEANKDLESRLAAANDIICCLEKKIQKLTEWAGRQTDTAAMLKQLRDGTCQELSRYKREAEEALNGVIDAMRCQREADNHAKSSLIRDKAALEECLRQTQARFSEAQAQLAACCQDKATISEAFEKEKCCAQARITDLEKKLNDLTDLVAAKVKDATIAREAQVALNTEIGAYRSLLDKQEQTFANCVPCTPCNPRQAQPRPLPNIPAETAGIYCDKADMPSNCVPCAPPSPVSYRVNCRPDNTFHRQGDYPYPACGPSKPFQPSGATGMAGSSSGATRMAGTSSEKPFVCPKGKGPACDCPEKPGNGRKSTDGPYATTYMKSFSPTPNGGSYARRHGRGSRRY